MSTIKEIAKAANVSISTVSKALHSRTDISKSTRDRVLRIAREYNYISNVSARSGGLIATENIGIIFCRESQPLSLNPFYSRVLEGIEAELAINNYNLVLHLLPDEKSEQLPKMLREQTVDGVILIGVFNQIFVKKLKEMGQKVILIDPKIITSDFSQVLIDNEHGAFVATQYLINHGHRKIGFISGLLERLSFQQRYTGYRKALEYNHIKFDETLVQTGYLEEGYLHTSKLLEQRNRPTAIFSANDINAIYGYQAIKDAKFRIPDDISIIGFDDIDISKMATPPLTTIRVYKEEMGSIAVRMLIQLINNELDSPVTTMVPTKLIERESVKFISE